MKKKQKNISLFLLTLSSLLILSSFVNFRSVHVKFHNKTGEDIDSLVVAKTFIGHLKNGSSTDYIDFKKFEFDGDLPYEEISGISNNIKLEMLPWSWCGTERNTKSKGSYVFDIRKKLDEKGNTRLFLVEHNKKIFWEEKQ